MKWLLAICLLICAVPSDLPAGLTSGQVLDEHWTSFNDAVNKKTAEIKGLLFGPIMRIAGFVGIAYAMVMLWMAKFKPMLTWGGIGILMNIIPVFIDSVFGAMLPGY